MPQDKELEKLLKKAQKAGFIVKEPRGRGHFRTIFTPSGDFITHAAKTPEGPGTLRRVRRLLRKHGFEG